MNARRARPPGPARPAGPLREQRRPGARLQVGLVPRLAAAGLRPGHGVRRVVADLLLDRDVPGAAAAQWGWAFALGLLAGLSRPLGVLLVIPALDRGLPRPATGPTGERVPGPCSAVAPGAGGLVYLGGRGSPTATPCARCGCNRSSTGGAASRTPSPGSSRRPPARSTAPTWAPGCTSRGPSGSSSCWSSASAVAGLLRRLRRAVLLIALSAVEPRLARALRAQRLPAGAGAGRDPAAGVARPGRRRALRVRAHDLRHARFPRRLRPLTDWLNVDNNEEAARPGAARRRS